MITQNENESLSEFMARNLEYYVENPERRCATDLGACFYNPNKVEHETEGCFVGRLLTKKLQELFDDTSVFEDTGLMDIIDFITRHSDDNWGYNISLDDIPNFIVDNKSLLGAFQVLHDRRKNWSSKGLSEDGRWNLQCIINSYGLESEPFKKFL